MMGRVIINQNSVISSTELSNIFIDEYLADANDAEIKVYLYLLRMMCAGLSTSVSDLADKFNYTEKDVIRALKYWETLNLMTLEYDDLGQLLSIHMQDITPKKNSQKTRLYSVTSMHEQATSMHDQVTSIHEQAPSRQKPAHKKPKEHHDNPQMIFVAEQYFGRTLNPTEVKTIFYVQDTLDFSDDLLDYLLQHCASAGKTDFDYVRKTAINWHQKGISTPEEARLEGTAYRNAYTIMKELGMQNAPTGTELQFFDRWQSEYGFSLTIITEACRRTVLQTQTKRLQYCDGILRNWYEKGAHTLEDIKQLDADFSKTMPKSTASRTEPVKFGTKFNRFKQNDYNLDDMENQLLDN